MLKRPICIATVFYIIGIIIGLYIKVFSIAFFIFIFGIILIFIYLINLKAINKFTFIILLIFCLGFIRINSVNNNFEKIYKYVLNLKKTNITAIVTSEAIDKDYKDIYYIKILSINEDKNVKDTKWILNIKKSSKTKLKYGDIINFNGSIKIANEERNYKGFNYKEYLKTKNICGNINSISSINITDYNNKININIIINNISKDIKEKINKLLPKDLANLSIGILLGDKENISEDILNSFNNSSLMHIIAVSGMHVSYIILFITIIFNKAFGKNIRKIITILFLIFFMALTNFTPSIQRATIMTILTIFSSLIYRKRDIYTNISFSAFIILLINPYNILDIGFELSYAGIIGIAIFYEKIKKKIYLNKRFYKKRKYNVKEKVFISIKRYFIDIFLVTISANIVIMPILMLRFNKLSFLFWTSSMLVSPLIGIIIICLILLYILYYINLKLAILLAFPLKFLIELLINISKFCENLPFSNIMVKTPYIFEIIFYYIIVFIIFKLEKLKNFIHKKYNIKKYIFIILIIFFIICIIIFPFKDNLKIYFIDVGQGDCTLICAPNRKKYINRWRR